MQSDGQSVAVIVNPQSANGKTGRNWGRIQAKLALACPRIDVMQTESAGHAIELYRKAVRSGYSTIIIVGGDGTLNETVNGILSEGTPNATVTLGLIPQGTGSDFRRTVNLPLSEDEAIGVIDRGETAVLDAMRVVFQDTTGANRTRYALNITSFGMGGAVAERANRSSKPLGGRAAFLTATAVTGLGFRGNDVSIQADGGEWRKFRITNVAVGNGQYHGAGMHICPRAIPNDGFLDVTLIEQLSLLEVIRNSRILFNGQIYDHPKIHHSRVKQLAAKSPHTTRIEIDGEPLGQLPLKITILPTAIRMFVP